MRRFGRFLIVSVIILSLLQATACTSQIPNATPSSTGTPSATAVVQTIDQVRLQLQETGHAVVASREMASELAGYDVGVPAFIPPGFFATDTGLGTFDVSGYGTNTPPAGMTDYPFVMQRFFARDSDPTQTPLPFFKLIQSVDKQPASEDSVTIDISGHPGKMWVTPGSQAGVLFLIWSDGKTVYRLSGFLVGPLDEATLVKVARSVTTR